jgi:hypothetical protein
VLDVIGARLEGGGDHGKRDQPDRHVDVEDPAPGEIVDEEAADQRSKDGRHTKHAAEVALVAPTLARREDVADHGDRDHDQASGPESLDRPEDDQLGHVLADPGERRADQEDDDRRLQHDLASVLVAELSVHRPCNR